MVRQLGWQCLPKNPLFGAAPGQQPNMVLEQTQVGGPNTSWVGPEPIDPQSVEHTGDDVWRG